MSTPRFQFGNVVVVEDDLIGVILKTWEDNDGRAYNVYVRSFNETLTYLEEEVKHFVYSKELTEEEKGFY